MKLPWDSKLRINREEGRYCRERSHSLYHTSRWTKLSASWRAAHPLCAECAKKGIIKAAEHTDHVLPWPVCGEQGFFDVNNLQSLCATCNNEKGQRDKALIRQWRELQRGVGGANLSEVFAQDHAPRKTRTMSKFREFGENGKRHSEALREG